MDQTHVRACCNQFVSDLSVRACGSAVWGQGGLDDGYVYFMGVHFLYLHQYSVWLDGVGSLTRAKRPRGLIDVEDDWRHARGTGNRCGNADLCLRDGQWQYRAVRSAHDNHRRGVQRAGNRLLSALFSACPRACGGSGKQQEAGYQPAF